MYYVFCYDLGYDFNPRAHIVEADTESEAWRIYPGAPCNVMGPCGFTSFADAVVDADSYADTDEDNEYGRETTEIRVILKIGGEMSIDDIPNGLY